MVESSFLCAVFKTDFPQKGGELKMAIGRRETGIFRLPCGSEGVRPALMNLGAFDRACFPYLNQPARSAPTIRVDKNH